MLLCHKKASFDFQVSKSSSQMVTKANTQKVGIATEKERCSLSLFKRICALVLQHYLLLYDDAQCSSQGSCLLPCTNLFSEPLFNLLFFFVVQCVAPCLIYCTLFKSCYEDRIIHFLMSFLRALLTSIREFISHHFPVRCGGGIMLGL